MALQWPVDKLTLINSALVQTGNSLVAVLDDGSDEYNVSSAAYERGLAYAMADGNWVSATKVIASLTPTTPGPTDDQFDTAYNLPADLLHLIWVRLSDSPVDYTILAGQLVLRRFNSGTVSIKYISTDHSVLESQTPAFVLALEDFVKAGIYRGLNEDFEAADAMMRQAMDMFQRAKTRSAQQTPKRALFNSRISMSRRVRRPWLPLPPGWSGTGNPG